MDKNKQWKNELLMEQLRAKSLKTFQELAKNTRLNLLERRYNIDAVEKQTLQSALDNLQNNIQIKNKGHLVERLEMLTRKCELKFTDNANTNSLFISSDMFYLEILLDPQFGKVIDVKVHHNECSNESSEPHLVEVLRRGDFIDFTQQLEGFQSIYQLNAESKIKSKAFTAIQALENDLSSIFQSENMQHTPEALVLTSSVGLLTKRCGGHPMKLLFFVRPTELLNLEQKRMDSLTNALSEASLAKKSIGNSVTINLEAAAPSNKLQIAPLLVKNGKNDGGFNYTPINPHNSAMLPAAFVLRLNDGIAVTLQIADEIKKITNSLGILGEETVVVVKTENPLISTPSKDPKSLINLIVERESAGSYTNGQKGLFVSLADQSHCYFINDNPELTGTVIKSIQFSEPSHVVKIIKLLRQQALFNALIASCVRKPGHKQDFDCYMFEIQCVSLQFIQIFVQHPIKETIVTVELDLTDVKQLNCKINLSNQQFDAKLENYILRVFQKTMSIPMILRSLIKYWDAEAQEFQRVQKRLYHNGVLASNPESKSAVEDKKDDSEKDHGDNSTFSGSQQDVLSGNFDICGVNKNEIFFKNSEQKAEKRNRQDFVPSDDLFQRHKISQVMSFDMDVNNVELALSERNLNSEDFLNNVSPSSKTASGHKPMDVFEFNDPSPPPTETQTALLPPAPIEDKSKKIPTPRASPSASSSSYAMDKRSLDIDLVPMKISNAGLDATINGQASIPIMPVNSSSKSSYEKLKSEKKKKRKRESNEGDGQSLMKKKSNDSLSSSPSKKSSSSSQIMGKPVVSFKPTKSPLSGASSIEPMDDMSFLNLGADQQTVTVSSPLPSPQSLLKTSSSAQANRKRASSSLSAVINKLKSEMSDAMGTTGGDEKKGEYMIKSSGSDGIKITFNKTKSSKGSKSPKHTGLKPGVNSGPKSSKSSSQKLLYQKSSSSGSLSYSSSTVPSPKSSSQPGKSSSSSKEKSKDILFSSFSSNDMLKNMLNLGSPAPRSDLIKAFDKKFQIPKLSARKVEDKPSDGSSFNLVHPRSAPSTPLQSSTPSPTMDHLREPSSSQFQMSQQRPFSNLQPPFKLQDTQRSKKLFKSVSSEQLFDGAVEHRHSSKNDEITDVDFQTFLKAQSRLKESSVSMHLVKGGNNQQSGDSSVNDSDLMDLNFIGNEL